MPMPSVAGSESQSRPLDFCSHHFGLCNSTSSPESCRDSQDLSPDLLPELSQISRAIDLRQFLVPLLPLVTQARVSPPRPTPLPYFTPPPPPSPPHPP